MSVFGSTAGGNLMANQQEAQARDRRAACQTDFNSEVHSCPMHRARPTLYTNPKIKVQHANQISAPRSPQLPTARSCQVHTVHKSGRSACRMPNRFQRPGLHSCRLNASTVVLCTALYQILYTAQSAYTEVQSNTSVQFSMYGIL
jgi:hypothetical protein